MDEVASLGMKPSESGTRSPRLISFANLRSSKLWNSERLLNLKHSSVTTVITQNGFGYTRMIDTSTAIHVNKERNVLFLRRSQFRRRMWIHNAANDGKTNPRTDLYLKLDPSTTKIQLCKFPGFLRITSVVPLGDANRRVVDQFYKLRNNEWRDTKAEWSPRNGILKISLEKKMVHVIPPLKEKQQKL